MLGLPGRINIYQVILPYLNYLSDEVRQRMAGIENKAEFVSALVDGTIDTMIQQKDPKSAFKILAQFFKAIDTPDREYLEEYFEKLPAKKQRIFIDKVVRNGIYIMQDPTLPTTVEQLENATKMYDVKPESIIFPDGSKSLRKVIVSPTYVIRLKQDC